ncbi:MAG: OsmC family protein [Bacillota bacterium]
MSSPSGMSLTVQYRGGMSFVGRGPSGHPIPMDAAQEVGGGDTAPRPMELILAALGGCSGIDVVHILRKMRIPFDALEIRLHGTRRDEHPRRFTSIEVEYVFRGAGLADKRARLEEAVRLSQEKYCSVAAMLNQSAPISWRVTVEDNAQ